GFYYHVGSNASLRNPTGSRVFTIREHPSRCCHALFRRTTEPAEVLVRTWLLLPTRGRSSFSATEIPRFLCPSLDRNRGCFIWGDLAWYLDGLALALQIAGCRDWS